MGGVMEALAWSLVADAANCMSASAIRLRKVS